MSNIDPDQKRKKQTRVRKQLVKKSLHEESEENSQTEVQQKVTKKYHNFLQILRKIGDYDWTDIDSTNSTKVIYPIQFLQPSALQFMISAQYFNYDSEYLCSNLLEVQKIIKKTEQALANQDETKKQKKQKPYDINDDIFILEMRHTKISNLDDLIAQQETQLEKITQQNEDSLTKLRQIIPDYIKNRIITDQSNGILRDITGLTETERQYIEKIEIKIQTEGQENVVCEGGKKTQGGGITIQSVLDDALCQVCNDGDYTDDNLIVFCSKCNISVHQKCYLIDIIPNEDWICDVCNEFGKNGQFLRCALCPRLGGAMKPTEVSVINFQNTNTTYFETQGQTLMKDDMMAKILSEPNDNDEELYYDFCQIPNRDIRDLDNNKDLKEPFPSKVWVHLSCFYWSPECYLDEKVDLLKGIDQINPKRYSLVCNICNIKKAGMCIQCARGSCQTAFHVECARRAGIFLTQIIVNNKPDYQIFCQKHVPLKVKRLLESKQRLYEREIIDFFRAYEKCRSNHKKQGQKQKKPKALKDNNKLKIENQDNQETEFDLIDFAAKLKEFIDKITEFKFIINLSMQEQQYVIDSINEPLIKFQKQYALSKLPESYQNKVDQTGLLVTQFYKSTITATDELWKHFKYRDYEKDITYKMYEKLRRRASKYMQELIPVKKQAKLLDLLMLKKNIKNKKSEQKKEIIYELRGEEYYQKDDNLYCVCRGKFKDGEPMICCDYCEEWFHFECLDIIIPYDEATSLPFTCFLCVDELNKEQQNEQLVNQIKMFKDPSFKLQRELAEQYKLKEARKKRLKELTAQRIEEEKQQILQQQEQQQEQEQQEILEEKKEELQFNQISINMNLQNNLQEQQIDQAQNKEVQNKLEIENDNSQFKIEKIELEDFESIQNENIELKQNDTGESEKECHSIENQEKGKKADEQVKTPSKTESVEDHDNKLEVPDTQEKQNTCKLKQKTMLDYFQKKQ